MSQSPIQFPMYDAARSAIGKSISLRAAIVATAFSAVVAVLMTTAFIKGQSANPLVSGQLQKMKVQLEQQPTDESLKNQIRHADRIIRESHFQRRAFILRGSYLLLGGIAAMLIALKLASRFSRRPPNPEDFPPPVDPWNWSGQARGAVGIVGLILLGGLGALAAMGGPTFSITNPISPTPAIAWASDAEMEKNWPMFRGNGTGIATPGNYPTDWDGPSGKGILWKSLVPLAGNNSPIVWNDRVLISGASAKKQEVYCFDAATGKLLWQQDIGNRAVGRAMKSLGDTGYAPSTLATDGQRVFAIFVTGDIAGIDLSGRLLWTKNLGLPENLYGHASSLAVYQDRLIVQYDQGGQASEGKSAIIALDTSTGRQIWKTMRPVESSWASPIVIHPPSGPQIITAANPWVIAYEPQAGKELWRAEVLDGEVAPSPTYADGKVFVANDRAKAAPIRVDGHGDVTRTHVLWSAEEGLPDIVSPLATQQLMLTVMNTGTLTCYDAKDGNKLWDHDYEVSFHASPVLAGNCIYLVDRSGVTHRFEAMPQFKDLGISQLGEAVSASPAFVNGKIYIRGIRNLYCIGSK